MEGERMAKQDAAVKMMIPQVKTFFIPYISAILPKGIANIADAKKNAVVIQVNKMALAANSWAIGGSAMLTEEPIKGTMKDAMVATSRADILLTSSFIQ